ncbi:hypothetical protein O6H91_06G019600 [Diphasiastrum complanatum]|uniref:Uncharacterized protein n=1 Tax=Diphasiastrum complanatum TaxID=34168 RepID=A0ACC2DBT9_DIPCM|nr:hypothetical protein O6H91_06G019600 [Diphasiastrum complanatum]
MASYQGKRKMEGFSMEAEVKESMKAARVWEAEKEKAMSNGNGYWMRLQQQKQEVAATPSAAPLSYQQRFMAAAALQEIRTIDSSGNNSTSGRQIFQPPSPRLHHLQQALQHQQQQQQQATVSDCPSLLDCSSTGNHSLINLPNSGRSSKIFSDPTEAHASAAGGYPPAQAVLGTREIKPASSLIMAETEADRYVNYLLLSKNGFQQQQQQQQNGLLSTAGLLVQDQQISTGGWFSPPVRDPNSADPSQQLSPLGLTGFSSAAALEFTDQSSIAPLPLPQCPPSYRDIVKEQEQVQATDPLNAIFPGGAAAAGMSVGGKSSGFMQPRMLNQSMQQNAIAQGKRPAPAQVASPFTASSMGDVATTSNGIACNGGSEDMGHGFAQPSTSVAAPKNKVPTRTYTKVYKLGSIGRALDVTRFSDYTELRCELARMFGLDGQLDQKSGWQLVFVDNENDILLVGDDPWEVFVSSVRGIRILSPSEVSYYMNCDERTGAPYNSVNSTVMKRH